MNKPQLPKGVNLAPDDTVSFNQFCIIKSREFNITYKGKGVTFSAELVEKLALVCLSDEDLNEDDPPVLWDAMEAICIALEQSKEYQHQSNNHMTDTTTDALNETTMPQPDLAVADEQAEPLTLQAQEYVATLEAQEKEQLEKRNPKEANSQELAIVQAAHAVGVTVSLEEARADLATKFDLGAGSNMLRPLGTIPITPMDLGKAMVWAAKVEQAGSWVYADAVNMLMQLGFEHVTNQIAAMLGKANSTLYNYARTARKIPQELRDESIPLTVYSELVNRRYDENEEKNTEIITELANQAVKEKWSCGDARSFADLAQGKQPKTKKEKYRYIVTLPGLPPYLTHTQPGYSEGVQVVDIVAQEYLRDVDNKIEFVPLIKEPTDEQIRELQQNNK